MRFGGTRKEPFLSTIHFMFTTLFRDGTFSVNHLRVGSILAQFPCLIGCEVAFEFESGFTFILMGLCLPHYSVLAMILLWLRQRDFLPHAPGPVYYLHVCLFLGCFLNCLWPLHSVFFILAWVKSKHQGNFRVLIYLGSFTYYFLSVFFIHSMASAF